MKTDQLLPWPSGRAPDPTQASEDKRAAVLAAYDLDALESDPELVQITQFAAKLCNAPVALVSLVEQERQRFVARDGTDITETPRPTSLCAHAMLEPELMVVPDASKDPRFADFPLVTGSAHLRFYAGAPLISHEGTPLGALCINDTEPRPEGLTDIQREGLTVLAASVMRRLRHRREALAQEKERAQAALRLQQMTQNMSEIIFAIEPSGQFTYYNHRWADYVGGAAPDTSEAWREFMHPDDVQQTFADWYECVERVEPYEGEFRLRMKDGSWRWFLARTGPDHTDETQEIRWYGTLTDVDETHLESEQRDLLARELSHRIKNIFAVISGLISLRTRGRPELEEFGEDISATIRALGRAHDFVRPVDTTTGEDLRGLLEVLMAPYQGGDAQRLQIDGDDVPISVRAATPLALVFHELATNSAKYGAFSTADGKVIVSVEQDGDDITVSWREEGGPKVVKTDRQGFGSRLIRMAVQSQLRGTLHRDMLETGMVAVLKIPADAIA